MAIFNSKLLVYRRVTHSKNDWTLGDTPLTEKRRVEANGHRDTAEPNLKASFRKAAPMASLVKSLNLSQRCFCAWE